MAQISLQDTLLWGVASWKPPTAVPLGPAIAFTLRSQTPQQPLPTTRHSGVTRVWPLLPDMRLLHAQFLCWRLAGSSIALGDSFYPILLPSSFPSTGVRCILQSEGCLCLILLALLFSFLPTCYLQKISCASNSILASGSWRTHPRPNFVSLFLQKLRYYLCI